jgi:hypothetical protein
MSSQKADEALLCAKTGDTGRPNSIYKFAAFDKNLCIWFNHLTEVVTCAYNDQTPMEHKFQSTLPANI